MEQALPNPAFIASLAPKNFDDAKRLVALVPPEANAIEYRVDLAPGRISPRALLDLDPRCAIITYRSVREGGRFDGSLDEYRRSVESAYDAGAVVDVELESGLLSDPDFLPDRRRVIGSRHGAALSEGRLRACLAHDVVAVKIVLTDPDTVAEAVGCIERTRRLSREKPIACFATGTRGVVTRVLGSRFGGALSYGSVDGETGSGQLPLKDLFSVYGSEQANPPEKLFAIYGADVSGSLSPKIHNAIFRHRGLPWLYVPLSASLRGASFDSPLATDLIALESLSRNLAGVSVTNPFKSDFGGVAEPDAEVSRIGAANTLVRRKPECLDLSAHNTDVAAVRAALASVGGASVLVLGTGGAARAAIAAAVALGQTVAVAGRDPAKAAAVSAELGASAVAFSDLESAGADVVVNATPLGSEDDDPLPFPRSLLAACGAVVDFVYRRNGQTALIRKARARGVPVVDGLDLLARQAVGQAELFGVPDATLDEIHGILRENA